MSSEDLVTQTCLLPKLLAKLHGEGPSCEYVAVTVCCVLILVGLSDRWGRVLPHYPL